MGVGAWPRKSALSWLVLTEWKKGGLYNFRQGVKGGDSTREGAEECSRGF